MVPTDDIEEIRKRNEERQKRLQDELAKLKPSESPPPPSAFTSVIDEALSSTPLDQLAPDVGVPVPSEETVVDATPPAPQPPTEFSFDHLEATVAETQPTVPPEFGISETPTTPQEELAGIPIAEATAQAVDDFFSDLPSSWGEAPATAPDAAQPALTEEPVPTEFPSVEEAISEFPSAPEIEVTAPVETPFATVAPPPTERVPTSDFMETTHAPVKIDGPTQPEPVTPEVATTPPVAEPIVATPDPQVDLPRVIVALDQGRLRWGRVSIEDEEEAIELLERAIAAYRSIHPKS